MWKEIPGYEGFYQINEYGIIKCLSRIIIKKSGSPYSKKEEIKKTFDNGCGYLTTTLCKNGVCKPFTIHRLVAITFLNNPSNYPCINHKDGNKLNNHYSNIEWCTYSHNNLHAFETGLNTGRFFSNKKSSKYMGVYWRKDIKKWASCIKVDGKTMGLGSFNTELEASNVFQKKYQLTRHTIHNLNLQK